MRGTACQWYTITVTDGATAGEVSWNLIDQNGVIWASGGAPYDADISLPDGCYTLQMFDSGSDGWEDIDWIIEDWVGDFDWDTNLPDGPHGTDTFVLGEDLPCDPASNPGCAPGALTLQFIVTSGGAPAQIGWDVSLNGAVIASGGAPFNDTLCLAQGCYVLRMTDAASNGWNGATYTLKYFGGATLYNGTLASGGADSVLWSIDGATGCTWPDPGGPSGGNCPNAGDPPGDCPNVMCVCDSFTFPITSSGFGTWNEIPLAGSQPSNPYYSWLNPPPWGGTDYGCLLAGELNSSWMMFTVGTSGSLGFSFGAGGQQVGFYDWSMWPYSGPSTCAAIAAGTLAPVRCLWNAANWGGTGLADVLPSGGHPGNYGPQLNVTAGEQYIICLSNWSYVTATVTLDFFGTATLSCTPSPLPIELLSFDAMAQCDHVHATWVTATEHNSDHFEVQRSTDLQEWATIGQVAAAGESNMISTYALDDASPRPGWNYYRLKEIDRDGSAIQSEVRTVYFDAPHGVAVIVLRTGLDGFAVPNGFRNPTLFASNGQQVPCRCASSTDGSPDRCIVGAAPPGLYMLVDQGSGRRMRLLISGR